MKKSVVSLLVAVCLATFGATFANAAQTAVAAQRATVSVNSASVKELQSLPGVGSVTAQRIVDWREANGSFKTVSDLQKVKGLGPKTVAKLKPLVNLN